MKQRLTLTDLGALSPAQKENLRKLWMPARYQLATAQLCVNAETDEYMDVEFCIGGVKVTPNGRMQLSDLRAIDGFVKLDAMLDGTDEDGEGMEEPTSFNRDDCLPLLTIGEIIEIMQRMNFSNFHFYLLAGTGVVGCEVGNFNSAIKADILDGGYQQEELCNVLWAMLLSQL